jgi:hypothetical protein
MKITPFPHTPSSSGTYLSTWTHFLLPVPFKSAYRLNNTPQLCILLKYTLSTALFILCCSDGHKQEAPQAVVMRCDGQRSVYWTSKGKRRRLLKKTNFWPKFRSVPADMPNNKPIFSLFRAEKIPLRLMQYSRRTKTPGARQPWRLNFVQWRLIFMDPQYEIWFMSPFWHLEFWGGLRSCNTCLGEVESFLKYMELLQI